MKQSLNLLVCLNLLLPLSTYGVDHQRNLEIVDSIPLIKDLENPAKDEKEIQNNLVNIFESFAIKKP